MAATQHGMYMGSAPPILLKIIYKATAATQHNTFMGSVQRILLNVSYKATVAIQHSTHTRSAPLILVNVFYKAMVATQYSTCMGSVPGILVNVFFTRQWQPQNPVHVWAVHTDYRECLLQGNRGHTTQYVYGQCTIKIILIPSGCVCQAFQQVALHSMNTIILISLCIKSIAQPMTYDMEAFETSMANLRQPISTGLSLPTRITWGRRI